MARIALAGLAAAVASALLAVPASAKTQVTLFDITRAQGFVQVTFAGSEAAGCRQRGVCGLSGTNTYSFGGRPEGFVYMVRNRGRTLHVSGDFRTRAQAVSDVGTAGSTERCVDTVAHREERFSFEPHSRRLEFYWRDLPIPLDLEGEIEDLPTIEDYVVDPFATRCAGPALRDLFESEALPEAEVPYRVFRAPRGSFRTRASKPFAGGGFAGAVEWDLRYAVRRGQRRDGGGFSVIFR